MRYFFFVLFVFILFVYPASAEIRSGDIVRNSSCGDGYYKIAHVTTGSWPCYKGSECCTPDVSKNNTCTYIVTLAGTTPEKGSCYYPTKIITLSQIPPPPPPCGENPPDDDKDGVCNQCDTKPGEPDPKDCMHGYTVGADGNQNGWFIDPGCSGRSNEDHEFYGSSGLRQSSGGGYMGDDMVSLGEPEKIAPKNCTSQSNGTCGCSYPPSAIGPGRVTPPYEQQDYPDISTLGSEGGSDSGGSGSGSGSGGSGSGSGSGGSEGGSGSGGSGSGSGSGGSGSGSGSGGSEGGSGSGGSGGGSGSGGSEGGSGSGGSEGGSGSGSSEGGSGSGSSEGGSGSGNGEGGGNGEGDGNDDNKDKDDEKYDSVGRPEGADAYSPGEEEFSVSGRFQTMVGTIKGTQLFNFSRQFFEGVPSGGTPTINFDGGRRYGKHTINLSDTMGSALAAFKAIVLSIFAFLSIRAVIMKR